LILTGKSVTFYSLLGCPQDSGRENFGNLLKTGLRNSQTLREQNQKIVSDKEELDPKTKEWLQTAAVLGTKKATGQKSLEE